MKYTVYVKKEIKSEADLPKDRKSLICQLKGGGMATVDYTCIPNDEIIKRIDWYLQPLELYIPDNGEITNESAYHSPLSPFSFTNGVKWLRNKIENQLK